MVVANNIANTTRINALAQVPSLITEEGLCSLNHWRFELSGRALPSASVATRNIARRMSSSKAHRIWHSAFTKFILAQQTDRWDGDRLLWGKEIIQKGLEAVEEIVAQTRNRFSIKGDFLFGETPSLADCCLVPQLYNARRFGCDLSNLTWSILAEQALLGLPQTASAHPDQQPDAQ